MIKCGIDSLGFSISEPQQRPSPAVVPFNENPAWASSSVGRTPDWQSGCRGFDSHLCPHYFWDISPVGVDATLSRWRSWVRVPYIPLSLPYFNETCEIVHTRYPMDHPECEGNDSGPSVQ